MPRLAAGSLTPTQLFCGGAAFHEIADQNSLSLLHPS